MTETKKKPLAKILAMAGLLAVVLAIGLSIYLACKHSGVCSGSTGCTLESGLDGCSKLGDSTASKIKGTSIPIAYAGLFYYLFIGGLLLIYILRSKAANFNAGHLVTLLTFMVVIGVVVDIILGFQNFAMNADSCRPGTFFCEPLCKLCAYTYIMQFLLAAVTMGLYAIHVKNSDQAGSLGSAWQGLIKNWAAPGGALVLTLFIALTIWVYKPTEHLESTQPPLPTDAQAQKGLKGLDKEAKLFKISTAGLKSYEGPENPVVVIHKFADFMCPHCEHTGNDLLQLRKRWPNRVGIYYRYLPLDGACNFLAQGSNPQFAVLRCGSAKAAACAAEQNPEFFTKFYHGVFELMPRSINPTPDQLQKLAEKHGGDWNAMQSCMQTSAQGIIDRDLTVIKGWLDSKDLKGASTPIVTIDGYFLGAGSPDLRSMMFWVDSIILKKEGQRARQDFEKRFPDAK